MALTFLTPSKESWFLKKHLALYTSIWIVLNWILGCAFIPHNPVVTQDKIFYFGVRIPDDDIEVPI